MGIRKRHGGGRGRPRHGSLSPREAADAALEQLGIDGGGHGLIEHPARMDSLVLSFHRDIPGKSFADAWQASHVIRDLGGSAPDEATAPAQPAPCSHPSLRGFR